MTQGTLVGVRKFNSKQGVPCCTVDFTYPWPQKDLDDGTAAGLRTYSGFVPYGFDINSLNANSIGKKFNIEIAYYNNRNNLVYMSQV